MVSVCITSQLIFFYRLYEWELNIIFIFFIFSLDIIWL